jgi:hypothetical protein
VAGSDRSRSVIAGVALHSCAGSANVWLSEHAGDTGADAERLQREVAQFGEWEALQRQAERSGVSRRPPAEWQPADAQTLLLPEERTAVLPQR